MGVFRCLSLLLLFFVSAPALASEISCMEYQGSWIYPGKEVDGFKILQLDLECDSSSPLPEDFMEWVGKKEMPLRGYLSFFADGYKMGPFPYASVIEPLRTGDRLKTHYFYSYAGKDGYEFEDFDLELREGGLILWDLEECDSGMCEVQYLFTRRR